MKQERVRIGQRHTCKRCGNKWHGRMPKKPARCPGCKSQYWDRPRVRKAAKRG